MVLNCVNWMYGIGSWCGVRYVDLFEREVVFVFTFHSQIGIDYKQYILSSDLANVL